MSIDVEGAEAQVLRGLSLSRFRPWVLCIEAVLPGTSNPSHSDWESQVLNSEYIFATFDGVNRWYVAAEHSELVELISIPFNAIDAGQFGWMTAHELSTSDRVNRSFNRVAWQGELLLNAANKPLPASKYEEQLAELRGTLAQVEGSASFRLSRKIAKAGRFLIHGGRRTLERLPGPARMKIIRFRHLKHVNINLRNLTNPAFLGNPPLDHCSWINGEGLPDVPGAGLNLVSFTHRDAEVVSSWLDQNLWDSDAQLDRRMDNHGDELGRARAALRTRVHLLSASELQTSTTLGALRGNKVLFDARSLQSAAFGTRGIGRFAKAALEGARKASSPGQLVLFIDPGLEPLPNELAEGCAQISRIERDSIDQYSLLIQPSPMTATADPLTPLLLTDIQKVAIVFDFIPMHFPTVYLNNVAARSEYGAALDALKKYDDFICISHLAEIELMKFIGGPINSCVAWPIDISEVIESSANGRTRDTSGPIVVMTGDEPRKNTFGALAAIGAATSGEVMRDVVVLGMAGQETRVHHWSIAAAMRPGEAVTSKRLSDSDMKELLTSASLVVVASFDEGLSLPVMEAVETGTPVVASDIPAHRELLGSGSYLQDPGDLKALATAISKYRGNWKAAQKQRSRLRKHQHVVLEEAIADRVNAIGTGFEEPSLHGIASTLGIRNHLNVGIATPWNPQPTGVADFSTTTVSELALLADVTVYSTSGAYGYEGANLKFRNVDELLKSGATHEHDVLVVVVGNSHFHLPFLELLTRHECVVIAHDTRMVEFYMALRGQGGAAQVMLRSADPNSSASLVPDLDQQIDDMRLLQNAGLWEIARRSQELVLHSTSAADRIARETGITPVVLPFANQRLPLVDVTDPNAREAARLRLNFEPDVIHLASFGYVDSRTKMSNVVVEAGAWLTQWGYPVAVHLVGGASANDMQSLTDQATSAGIELFEITGFVSDELFRDYLLAVDLGIQLRVSPLLGVSGPLSDLAAFGTPAIASSGLAVDVDAPSYIHRLPDNVSALMVAEAVVEFLNQERDLMADETSRQVYLAGKSPKLYAELLLELLVSQVGDESQ